MRVLTTNLGVVIGSKKPLASSVVSLSWIINKGAMVPLDDILKSILDMEKGLRTEAGVASVNDD